MLTIMELDDLLILGGRSEPTRAELLLRKMREFAVEYSPLRSLQNMGKQLAMSLRKSDLLIISTGFPIFQSKVVFENDGPVGAIVLARMLEEVDVSTVFVVEKELSGAIQQLCEKGGVKFPIVVSLNPKLDKVPDILIDAGDPVLHIEKPGRTEDGQYVSMRGKTVGDYIFPPEELDRLISPKGVFAIGDAGNEHGSLTMTRGDTACAKKLGISGMTKVDEFLLAGTSNFGAVALSKILMQEFGASWNYTVEYEHRLMEVAKELNLVDGVQGRLSMSVDSIPWDEYLSSLNLLLVSKLI